MVSKLNWYLPFLAGNTTPFPDGNKQYRYGTHHNYQHLWEEPYHV